jgi:hypothetical protein
MKSSEGAGRIKQTRVNLLLGVAHEKNERNVMGESQGVGEDEVKQ